jgi:putative holliday junction resolvase
VRILALDVGDERIGVAISDQSGYLARPLEVLARSAGPASFARLVQLITSEQVSLLVVGLPLLADGSEGKQVQSVRAYMAGLVRHTACPFVYWDERYSSQQAAHILAENASRRRRRQRANDAVAAAIILQEYLDEQRGGPAL